MKPKKSKTVQSFKNAVEGVVYCIKTQRNMRIHLLAALLVILGSLFLPLTRLDICILFIIITVVIVCEMVNTAIEKMVDLYSEKYHPVAKIAKDVSAGAVLISALSSIFIGYLVFVRKFPPYIRRVIDSIKQFSMYKAFISVAIVLILIVALKYYLNSKKIVQGGMPSGHAAIAFSLVTIVLMSTDNIYICILALALGMLVLQSRVEAGIHSIAEVSVGAVLGALITYSIFMLLAL